MIFLLKIVTIEDNHVITLANCK